MQIQIACQTCGQVLLIDDQSTQTLQCPTCSAVVYSPQTQPIQPTQQQPVQQQPAQQPYSQPTHQHVQPQQTQPTQFPPAGQAPLQQPTPMQPAPQHTGKPDSKKTGGSHPGNSNKTKLIVIGAVSVVLLGLIIFFAAYAFSGGNSGVAANNTDSESKSGNNEQANGNSSGAGNSSGVSSGQNQDSGTGQESNVRFPLPTGKPAKYLEELQFVGKKKRDVGGNVNSFSPLPAFDPNKKPPMPMEYTWREFGGNQYQFQMQIKRGRHTQTVNGTNTIEEQKIGHQTFKKDRSKFESSGACFFVHPDGLAVTSADLVTYLKKVEVNIDGTWLEAKLVAVDGKTNIALIHVNQKNVPYLDVSRNPSVGLAEALQCAGFQAGTNNSGNATLSAGQVSGVFEDSPSKEFQFDTKLTKHHVGGPIFNPSGHVVGVTSTVFQLDKLNPVSIGVPSNSIFGMLSDNEIKIPAASKTIPLDSLRRKCGQAVCRIRASGTIKQDTVSYRAAFQSSAGIRGPTRTVKGASLLTSSGDVLETEGGGIVNFFVAPPGFVGIESLCPYGIDYWATQSVEYITKNPDFYITRSQLTEVFAPGPEDALRMLEGLSTAIRMDEFAKIAANEKYYDYLMRRTIRSLDRDENSPRFFDADLLGIVRFDLKNRKVVRVSLAGKMKTKYLPDLSTPVNNNQAHIFFKPCEYDITYAYELKKLGTRYYEQPPTVNNEFTVLSNFERIIDGAFSLNNEFVIGTGKQLRVIDAESKKMISQSAETENSFLALKHAPTRPDFYLRRKNNDIEKWTYNRDGEAFLVARKSLDTIFTFDVSPDNKFLAVQRPGQLEILNADDLSVIKSIRTRDRRIGAVGITAEGSQIVSVGDISIRLYDSTSLEELQLHTIKFPANRKAVSSDSRYAIFWDAVNFNLHDAQTGKQIYKQRFLENRLVKLLICEEEPDVVVMIHTDSIKRVRLSDFQLISEIKRPQKGVSVYPAILSRDGSVLTYGVDDLLHFEYFKQ